MDAVLQALSDPSRRTVLAALGEGPATAGELAALLPIARPGVSRHLRVLREAGLVEVRQEAQFRVYSLRPDPLAEVDEWLGHYRSLWESRLDALHTEIARGKKRTEEHDMTEETRATTRITGTMHSVDGKGVVRMDGRYDTDIDDLWSAVSDPARLARWVAEVEGDLHVGGAFRATFTSGWEGPGRVEVCEPPTRLLVTLSPGDEDETVVEAELMADGDQTRLVVEERGIPLADWPRTAPAGRPTSRTSVPTSRDAEAADWHTRWTELDPSYQERTVEPR